VSGNVTESCPNGTNPSGLPGTVQLIPTTGNPLGGSSAAGTGAFSFTGLAAGTYSLKLNPTGKAIRTIGNIVVGTAGVTVTDAQLNYSDRVCTTISG
jgi:hypothetical protein